MIFTLYKQRQYLLHSTMPSGLADQVHDSPYLCLVISSVQFSSVSQSCPALSNTIDRLLMAFLINNCWRRQWHPTPILLPGKSQGRRSLVGYSPWGHEELDTTERLHFQFSLSYVREGNGNPLQCSCLENPGDRGAWWAAVCGVAQSRTRLK